MVNLFEELVKKIKRYSGPQISIMEVCGTHTVSIFKHGIRELLPENIKLISGPGCPVCVTPQGYVDNAIQIAKSGAIVLTFGDMMKVPGTDMSLERAKAQGCNVKIVYSPLDSIEIAKANADKKVVFLAVGFETTSPVIALTIKKAKEEGINNLFMLCGMKLIIPALEMLCMDDNLKIDGFLLPGHVSAVIGQECYSFLPEKYNKACAIAGFEADEIMLGIGLILKQIENSKYKVDNAYRKVVSFDGNPKAKNMIFDVFEPDEGNWRGIGTIKNSGLRLIKEFEKFDAQKEFKLQQIPETVIKGCLCGEVIKGAKLPYQCKLFGKACDPVNPIGPCMVSSEGTCAAYYKYGHQ